jgi:CheY-like chemotaxis protein
VNPWHGRPALAVDDNEDSRKLATLILKREGMVVAQSEDGRQAVDQITGGEFDLVLMDLEMPVMSGLDAIRAIRALRPPRTVRIVGLSAHADDAARRECLAAGADGYLIKPLRLADLQKLLAALFGAA